MLRYAIWTTPLCTGAEAAGAAYLGVVLTLRLLLGAVVPVLGGPALLLEPPDEPHPVASASAQQAVTTLMALLIRW